MTSTTKGADGLGDYAASSSVEKGGDSNAMRAMVGAILSANGTATSVAESQRVSILNKIFSLFQARTADDKQMVEAVMVYYFAVHGTSPDTEWAAYGIDYPMVANSRQINPSRIVGEIGASRLKKFMGHYTSLAIQMVQSSPEFAAALSERAARAGLAAGQEHMAIDFVGKDGSLSSAENRVRVITRDNLLHYRSRNAFNLSQVKAGAAKPENADGRALRNGPSVMTFDS